MILIRMSITILLIAAFRVAVDGYGLPIFYSIDKEWKNTADDPLGFNNDHQSDTLGTWNNFNKKAHKMFPSVSPLDTIKWRLPLVQRRNGGGGTLQGVGQMNDKRDKDLKIAMDGLRRYFSRL